MLFTALLFCHATRAAPPPSKAACNAALQAALVTNLDFGDYEGAVAGTITVDTAGARTTTGPVLAGGIVSAAAYDVWNTLAGCETAQYYGHGTRIYNISWPSNDDSE